MEEKLEWVVEKLDGVENIVVDGVELEIEHKDSLKSNLEENQLGRCFWSELMVDYWFHRCFYY